MAFTDYDAVSICLTLGFVFVICITIQCSVKLNHLHRFHHFKNGCLPNAAMYFKMKQTQQFGTRIFAHVSSYDRFWDRLLNTPRSEF